MAFDCSGANFSSNFPTFIDKFWCQTEDLKAEVEELDEFENDYSRWQSNTRSLWSDGAFSAKEKEEGDSSEEDDAYSNTGEEDEEEFDEYSAAEAEEDSPSEEL